MALLPVRCLSGGRMRKSTGVGTKASPTGKGRHTYAMDLDQVAADLYALPPRRFTSARDAKAAEARASGDRDLAAGIKSLAKPTVSAWLANLLVRTKRREAEQLIALGPALRDAQKRLAGHDLRHLARERQHLVVALVQWAQKAANQQGEKVGERALGELQQTLEAALGDEQAAGTLLSGRLAKALRRSGLGGLEVVPLGTGQRPGSRAESQTGKSAAAERSAAELDRVRRQRVSVERELLRLEERAAKLEAQLTELRQDRTIAKQRLQEASRQEREVERRAEHK